MKNLKLVLGGIFMNKKFIVLLAFVLFLSITATIQAGVILKDNFDGTKYTLPWNLKTQGVPPGWDGMVYNGSLANNFSHLDVNDVNKTFFVRSRNQSWDANTVGFLLYKNVTGDFTATVRVTDFTGPAGGMAMPT